MTIVNLPTNYGANLPCTIDFPELIYGVTAVVVSHALNGQVYHPLTHAVLPVVVLPTTTTPYLLIPAHLESHFAIAQAHGLPIKQVVAPLYQGTGSQALRPDLPIQHRQSVIAVVKHWADDSYLGVDSYHRDCKSFVLGGRENGETPTAAAIREVTEETGYTDLVVDSVYPLMLLNHFYADYKGVNRHATLHLVFGHLRSDRCVTLTTKESDEHAVTWVARPDLRNFLTVKNNLFAVDVIEQGPHAYTGDGLMVNSGELDGLSRTAAREAVAKILG